MSLIAFVASLLGSFTGLLFYSLLFLVILWYFSRPKDLPPGPRGIPLLGYLPWIKPAQASHYRDLGKKYGSSVISFYLGQRLIVVLNDIETIRKALCEQGDQFSGRPKDFIKHIDPLSDKNVVFAEGPHWREHRKFAIRKFRDFGLGKDFESLIIDEISNFMSEIDKIKNEPFDIHKLLSLSICNNVSIMEVGKRLEYTDPEFLKVKKAIDDLFSSNFNTPVILFPWMAKIPGLVEMLPTDRFLRDAHSYLTDFMRKQVALHEKEYKDGMENDYINAYFSERNDRQRKKDFAESFDEDSLVGNLKAMFIAGMETTTTTLCWAFLYMILHKDVQRKLQKEVDDVIGPNRTPSFTDKQRMPYTEAVLTEVHRLVSVTPLSVAHRPMKDLQFNGYHIPEDAMVFPNLWAVHHDEKLFPDPESFRPERFLDTEGNFVKSEYVIPFSIGKRFCLGEPLARLETFLYFTTMLQRYTIEAPEGETLTTVPAYTAVHSPQKYNMKLVPR